MSAQRAARSAQKDGDGSRFCALLTVRCPLTQ